MEWWGSPEVPWEWTLWTVLGLVGNAALVVWGTLGLTWSVRRAALPTHAYVDLPLHFVFRTCPEGDGVCSFPTANLSLRHHQFESLLTPGLPYWLRTELTFPDSRPNRELGMVLAQLRLFDFERRLVLSRARSISLPYRSWAVRAARTLLYLPLLLLWGSEAESHVVGVDFFRDFQDSPLRPVHWLSLEVQSRRAVLSGGRLRLSAVFGRLGGFLYWWPLTSSLAIGAAVAGGLLWLSALYWARKGIAAVFASAEAYEQARRKCRESTQSPAPEVAEAPPEEPPELPALPPLDPPERPVKLAKGLAFTLPSPEPEMELRRRHRSQT